MSNILQNKDITGFLYRRFSFLFTCTFNFPGGRRIKLYDKHHVSSFQDVFCNNFYQQCLSLVPVKPRHVVDMGANLGFFSILTDHFFNDLSNNTPIQYTLIEANAALLNPIKKNLANFRISRYELLNQLVGPADEKGQFYVSAQTSMQSSMYELNTKTKKVSVDVLNLKERVDIMSTADIVKIDIEGAEYELFNNFLEQLCNARHLIIEFHTPGRKTDVCVQSLKNKGFFVQLEKPEQHSGFHLMMLSRNDKN